MVVESTRKRVANCLQRHSIGHGVINTLQVKGNQVAYQKKCLYNDEKKNGVDDTKHNIHQEVIFSAKWIKRILEQKAWKEAITANPLQLMNSPTHGQPLIFNTYNIFKQEDEKTNGKQRRKSNKHLSWIFNGRKCDYK